MEGVAESMRHKIVTDLLEELGLKDQGHKHPKELSGGMKQRVGIARALAIHPDALLLDEPFSSLDEFTASDLRNLLLTIWHKRRITVIMITHLIREALELSDRIVVLSPRPGTIKEIVKNPLKRPRDLRSEQFFVLEDQLKKLIIVD